MVERLELFRRARSMRRELTDAERRMWRTLRSRQFADLKFRRQLPIGNYIVDFACLNPRLIVECDGGQHADNRYDDERDAWLTSQGFRILRFWNTDILREPEHVEHTLMAAIDQR